MVRLDGRGKLDDRENGTNDNRKEDQGPKLDRGHQGFLLNDGQFNSLLEELDPSKYLGHQAQLRAQFDRCREFVLKSYLRDAELPTRAEINKALAATGQRLRIFLDRMADLGSVPNWPLADTAAIEGPSPFRAFMTLPWRLRSCAERARSEARMNNDHDALLIAVADAADGLADILMALDFASKEDVLKQLRWTNDYHLDRLDEAVRIVRRLGVAVDETLAAGKKRGGPRPQNDLKQADLSGSAKYISPTVASSPTIPTRKPGTTGDRTLRQDNSFEISQNVRFHHHGANGQPDTWPKSCAFEKLPVPTQAGGRETSL